MQDQLVERQVRSHGEAAGPLQILHPARLVGLQTCIFLTPPIIGLFADRDPPTRFRRRGALRQNNLRFTQLADNLFRAMLLARLS